MTVRRVYNPKDKPPVPAFVKYKGRAAPITAFDDELLSEYPEGQEFDLVPRQNRSNQQSKLYWLILSRAVEATGHWPSREYLHDELKKLTGHWRVGLDLKTMKPRQITDSTAFDKMNAAQFRVYFDQAMKALAEHLGVDPFELLKK